MTDIPFIRQHAIRGVKRGERREVDEVGICVGDCMEVEVIRALGDGVRGPEGEGFPFLPVLITILKVSQLRCLVDITGMGTLGDQYTCTGMLC